jgi:hypothetical protein
MTAPRANAWVQGNMLLLLLATTADSLAIRCFGQATSCLTWSACVMCAHLLAQCWSAVVWKRHMPQHKQGDDLRCAWLGIILGMHIDNARSKKPFQVSTGFSALIAQGSAHPHLPWDLGVLNTVPLRLYLLPAVSTQVRAGCY